LFVPFAAWCFFKEKISYFNIAGIVISIIGVLLTMLNKDLQFIASFKGLMLMSVAVISALAYTLIIRHLANDYSALNIITYQNLLGIPFFIPFFFMFDFSHVAFSVFTPDLGLVLLLMSLFPSSLSYMFYTYSIRKIGMSKTSVFTNLIPIITAISSFVLFNELLTSVKIIGIFIVIFGLFLSQYGKKEIG
jgi:drug/metabolite transporter (DMT)-like permease